MTVKKRLSSASRGFAKGNFVIIAGPCAVENRNNYLKTCRALQSTGRVDFFRGGAFKPRTKAESFQGLGEDGLKIMLEVKEKYQTLLISECLSEKHIELMEKYVDIIQVGSRNMYNYELLKALGKIKTPILLKRGLSATIDEWLSAADYIIRGGNKNVILCERGIRSFDDKYTRNVLDISAVPVVKKISSLPIIVDPSHATGRRDLIIPLSVAAKAVGADGIMVEVNAEPEQALCDGRQSLNIAEFKQLLKKI